jgi:cytochrome c peroxidase
MVTGCERKDIVVAEYNATPYTFSYPENFGDPDLLADNALTIEGVKLGKMLFYEKALSKNGSQSCADCHVLSDGFSDKNQFSKGVDGFLGKRQAMPIFIMALHKSGFFWDGRAIILRERSLKPIQDPLEMHETLENVVSKLRASHCMKFYFHNY